MSQESKPPVVELSEEARKRSKKLFGNLMGHLQKARLLFLLTVNQQCRFGSTLQFPFAHSRILLQAKTEVAQEQSSEKLQQAPPLLKLNHHL
jgi:hypothetical protein